MATFTATAAISGGTLSIVRPLNVPEPVSDLIDSMVYSVTSESTAGVITSAGITIVTDDSAPPAEPVPAEAIPGSDTPLGDAAEAAARNGRS